MKRIYENFYIFQYVGCLFREKWCKNHKIFKFQDRETVSSRTNEASSEDADSDASDWRDKELLDEVETEQRPIDQYNRDTPSVPSLEFIQANDGTLLTRLEITN